MRNFRNAKRTHNQSVFIFSALLLFPSADLRGDPISVSIRVVPELERVLDWFSHPPLLAIAMENNRIRLSNAGRIQVVDPHTLQLERTPPVPYKALIVKFVERKGLVFFYDASVALNLPPLQSKIAFKLQVDGSKISEGLLMVQADVPMAKLLPSSAMERVRQFIQKRLSATNQEIMVKYLKTLERQADSTPGFYPRHALLLQQTYNLSAGGTGFQREPGEVEPLSDQWLFIISVLIWGFLVPASLAVIYIYRRRMRRGSKVWM